MKSDQFEYWFQIWVRVLIPQSIYFFIADDIRFLMQQSTLLPALLKESTHHRL
jgi:hypothetical protein